MDQEWHSVFDNSMREPWLYFCYRLDVLVMNSLMLSIPYIRCNSVFSDDFKVYSDFVFADDFWSVVTRFSLAIPCVNEDSVFYTDFMRPPWISFRCRFHASSVAQFSMIISRSIVTQDSLTIFAWGNGSTDRESVFSLQCSGSTISLPSEINSSSFSQGCNLRNQNWNQNENVPKWPET
jgi:hypothetical protein